MARLITGLLLKTYIAIAVAVGFIKDKRQEASKLLPADKEQLAKKKAVLKNA